jgi:polar amino acid transport system substrate-binding protein
LIASGTLRRIPKEEGHPTMRTTRLVLVAVLGLLVAACTGGASPSPSPQLSPSPAPSVAPSPSPSPDACAKENLTTLTAGTLTVGADNPAFPPYFAHREGGNTPPWEDQEFTGDPTTGEGFESAVAYEIAKRLGFDSADVAWVPVPFVQSFAPGDKPFDMYLTQVSYNAERAQAVDLSDGYFDQNQTVIGNAGTPIADVTTVAGLKDFKLGAPVGTTSYQYIVDNIKPTKEPAVYDTLDAALQALGAKQIDGVVVDLPTAFYAVAVQLDNGTIVGVLPTVGEVEHFSVVLPKGSTLTECVNRTLKAMKDDGTLKSITDTWITAAGAPELK